MNEHAAKDGFRLGSQFVNLLATAQFNLAHGLISDRHIKEEEESLFLHQESKRSIIMQFYFKLIALLSLISVAVALPGMLHSTLTCNAF